MAELNDYIDKYEIVNYRYDITEKDLSSERLRIEKLVEEDKHLKSLY
jgi:hypothetical protein